MTDPTKELAFQNDVIAQLSAAGWKLGEPARYNRTLALYPGSVRWGRVLHAAERRIPQQCNRLTRPARPGIGL
jgi:hypothetical protein